MPYYDFTPYEVRFPLPAEAYTRVLAAIRAEGYTCTLEQMTAAGSPGKIANMLVSPRGSDEESLRRRDTLLEKICRTAYGQNHLAPMRGK